MNFEIQALGGKLVGSRSAMKTLDRLTTLLPNAKLNFEVIPPPETKKAEFGSMPDFRDPVSDEEDEDDITLAELRDQLKDNMTLAEIQKELVKVEATKKRLETIRLKKEKKEEGELHFESEAEYLRWDALRPFDEMTRQYPRAPDFELGGIDHVPNF